MCTGGRETGCSGRGPAHRLALDRRQRGRPHRLQTTVRPGHRLHRIEYGGGSEPADRRRTARGRRLEGRLFHRPDHIRRRHARDEDRQKENFWSRDVGDTVERLRGHDRHGQQPGLRTHRRHCHQQPGQGTRQWKRRSGSRPAMSGSIPSDAISGPLKAAGNTAASAGKSVSTNCSATPGSRTSTCVGDEGSPDFHWSPV